MSIIRAWLAVAVFSGSASFATTFQGIELQGDPAVEGLASGQGASADGDDAASEVCDYCVSDDESDPEAQAISSFSLDGVGFLTVQLDSVLSVDGASAVIAEKPLKPEADIIGSWQEALPPGDDSLDLKGMIDSRDQPLGLDAGVSDCATLDDSDSIATSTGLNGAVPYAGVAPVDSDEPLSLAYGSAMNTILPMAVGGQ